MRLPPVLVSIIAKGIFRTLTARGAISSDKPAETVSKLERLLALDLQKDEDIAERAKSMLESRYGEIKAVKDVDYRSLLGKAKKELAAREGFVPWGGTEKIPPEKVLQLSREVLAFFRADGDLEYFLPAENLRKEIALAFEKEKARDEERMRRAALKVSSIRRNIPEDSSEFVTLKEQFYREFLEKER